MGRKRNVGRIFKTIEIKKKKKKSEGEKNIPLEINPSFQPPQESNLKRKKKKKKKKKS